MNFFLTRFIYVKFSQRRNYRNTCIMSSSHAFNLYNTHVCTDFRRFLFFFYLFLASVTRPFRVRKVQQSDAIVLNFFKISERISGSGKKIKEFKSKILSGLSSCNFYCETTTWRNIFLRYLRRAHVVDTRRLGTFDETKFVRFVLGRVCALIAKKTWQR